METKKELETVRAQYLKTRMTASHFHNNHLKFKAIIRCYEYTNKIVTLEILLGLKFSFTALTTSVRQHSYLKLKWPEPQKSILITEVFP